MDILPFFILIIILFVGIRIWSRRKRASQTLSYNPQINAEIERWFLRLQALADVLRDIEDANGPPHEDSSESASDSPLSPDLQSIESEIDAIEAFIHRLRETPSALAYDMPREERRHLQWREAHELKFGSLPADPAPAGVPEETS